MQNEMYFDNDQEEIPRTVRRRKKQLYESIRERMEFYFSDANLQKDRFLSKLIQQDPQARAYQTVLHITTKPVEELEHPTDKPEVDLTIFLRFNRIQQLTNSLNDLKKALKKSEFLELSEDKTKVFRKTPVKEKTNVDACTIYVEQLSWDVDHDWLKQVFSRYGKVDYISIPKYKQTGKIKGFAFVEFETPEAAKAALDEFEKEGCCLTNSMNPEQLCSIATFEEDKHEKNQLGQPTTTNDTNKNKFPPAKVPEETESKTGTKRKRDEPEEKEEEPSPPGKKSKKTDLEETNTESSGDKAEKVEEVNGGDKNESHDETNVEVPTKKKKNRKKKKSLKTKPVKDVKMYGLQILSKADWKRLRNKYLNVQKEKMKKLKQHLYRNQLNIAYKQQQQQVVEPPTKPRFTFSEGTVIKVILNEPLKDGNQVNQFKCDARSLEKVEYVDVEIGSQVGYIRFGDANVVGEAIRAKPWDNMSVLEGKEEEEYWDKIKKDRCEKFENKKKFNKKRGRNKILDKTEKLISKRIRLSVDE